MEPPRFFQILSKIKRQGSDNLSKPFYKQHRGPKMLLNSSKKRQEHPRFYQIFPKNQILRTLKIFIAFQKQNIGTSKILLNSFKNSITGLKILSIFFKNKTPRAAKILLNFSKNKIISRTDFQYFFNTWKQITKDAFKFFQK